MKEGQIKKCCPKNFFFQKDFYFYLRKFLYYKIKTFPFFLKVALCVPGSEWRLKRMLKRRVRRKREGGGGWKDRVPKKRRRRLVKLI